MVGDSSHRRTRKRQRTLFQSYWSDAPLSLLERTCLTSWVRRAHAKVHLYTYDSIPKLTAQIPAEIRAHVTVLNASTIVPRRLKFSYTGPAPKSKRANAFTALPFSDLFRYRLLCHRGGIWMDMDIIMVRPIPARLLRQPYFFVSERTIQAGAYASAAPAKPTNSCMYVSKPNTKWAMALTAIAYAAVLEKRVDSAWKFMGYFQDSLKLHELSHYVEPPTAMMPLNWWDVDGMFAAGSGSSGACLKPKYGVAATCADDLFGPDTLGVHLFRGILRKRDLPYDDPARIPADSLYGRLIAYATA
jgi:hypothetical protein